MDTEKYLEIVEKIHDDYNDRALAVLKNIAEVCTEAGFIADEDPFDMSGDEYQWALRVWRSESKIDEDSIDIRVEFIEAQNVGDTNPWGVAWGIDMTEHGGRVLGGITPFNFTPELWVDARNGEDVEARFKIIEDAGLEELPELLKRKED